MLAASGWDTLRFDYYGTGDSAGDLVEANLGEWEKDIEWAVEEARATSGANRVALIGLRLGANLAASVAVRRSKEVDVLILWDPVVRGPEFLSEVHALEAAISTAPPLERASEAGGGHEILGFALTAAMAAEIGSLDLVSAVDGLPARTLTLVSRPTASYDELVSALARRRGNSVSVERISGLPPWLDDRFLGVGAIPVDALQRMAQWLS